RSGLLTVMNERCNKEEPDMGCPLLTVAVLSGGRLPLLEQMLASVRAHFDSVEPGLRPRWICLDNGSSPADQRRLGALGFDELIPGRNVPFYVQDPRSPWGGFCYPPAVTKTAALRSTGALREDHPHHRWWAEGDFSSRFARRFLSCKSPAMLVFKHVGDESS